ncbi:MAG: Fe-S cluster assembly ATPase SufC [Nisaea sp.]|nr:Fe-S cluster assembly ATPase SufC [Nisaea sp.]MEC7805506.1 Fe-S cluster assembly ATPase SufC [Pseudomonadota bacterium]MED5226383.1 Fe-S cluster assembly ATPase SufC [Pseudomonadota bacterium]MED5474331.1 Fe-S cluster assembly ATPase SufC [Pseudomonadota bacterium]
MLSIENLHASVGENEILRGINLKIEPGEVHAVMGPNGSGKSTLSYVLAGREGYSVTRGKVAFKDKDLLELEADERANEGVFLAFQYPVEVPGVTGMTFMREAYNSRLRYEGKQEADAMEFLKLVRSKAKDLNMSDDMLKRPVNVGFSGGEKKRNEILQMAVLEPQLAVLDETDSGLDIDALKLVADGVNALRTKERSMLIITHYQRLLDYIEPDHVHVLADGKIQRSGGKELALELEANGYAEFAGKG